MLLLSSKESYGAQVRMDRVFVDSSRARSEFDGPMILAIALMGMKEQD